MHLLTLLNKRAGLWLLESPSFAQQNTTATNDLSADGYTWANAPTIISGDDIIAMAQRHNGGDKKHYLVFSSDRGQTWTDNAGTGTPEGFLERVALAFDADNDILWALSHAGSEGAIIRGYNVVRTGGAITAINRDLGVSVALDSGLGYQHPLLIHI